MEGIREIVRCYYERASEEEKISVNDFFRKLDVDGDGKVSLQEIKTSAASWSSAYDIFQKLDTDGDRALDFNEFLCLHYIEKKISIARCSGCSDVLVGPYFSCTLCLGRSPDTYDLCCTCYRRGDFSHDHSSNYMLDHHSLIMLLKDRTSGGNKSQWKKEMDEVREIALSHYRACSPQVQALAYQFYQSMDKDGDGRVDLDEFLAFMRREGYSLMHNPYFFNELDKDGDGTLDFSEAVTLYYIINSGRPSCRCCGKFIPGIFFSCVECFDNPEVSFDLCRDCFRSAKCNHNHGGRAQFLDNYMLLQARRDPPLAQASSINPNEKEMEELREIAKAFYRAGCPQVQAEAHEFYQSMDTKGDGQIGLSEFLAFMRQEGYSHMRNPYFFNELDDDGNGTLDFSEVMTLYYIIKSGRPFCDCCGKFIPATFFSCVECCKNPENSFNLCPHCYRSKKTDHSHDGRSQFLDNYTLLVAKRDPAVPPQATSAYSKEEVKWNKKWFWEQRAKKCTVQGEVQSDDADGKSKPEQSSSPPSQSTTGTILPTLQAVGTGISITGAAVNTGLTIAGLAGCCIM